MHERQLLLVVELKVDEQVAHGYAHTEQAPPLRTKPASHFEHTSLLEHQAHPATLQVIHWVWAVVS